MNNDLYTIYAKVEELEEILKYHIKAKVVSITEHRQIKSELLFYKSKLKSKNIM